MWNGSDVLRELGQHPTTPSAQADAVHRVDAALDVSILFGYSETHMKAAADFVDRGHIRPASVRILSRLCLTTEAAMDVLGGDGSLHHSFRAVIRRHLEEFGPRTGVWQHVCDSPALVHGDVLKLKCMAWSLAPWTVDMGEWLRSVSLQRLCDNEWWWLVKRVLKQRTFDLNNHNTALRVAAGSGNLRMVTHVCALRCVNVGAGDNYAIRRASEFGHLHVVQYLCSLPTHRGVYPGASSNDAIRRAAANGHVQVVQYLCSLPTDRGVDPGANNNQAIRWAAMNGHLHVVQYLRSLPADRGVYPGASSNAAIRWAAANGHLQVVQYLCSLPTHRGVDPGASSNDAIRRASDFGHLQVVQYLCSLPIDRGVDPGASDNKAIIWAASNGHLQVVQYLCSLPTDRGVDPGANNNAAIRWAARHGHLQVVQYLCSLPADCGAWFLKINPHHDQQLLTQLRTQLLQALGILKRRFGIMNGAGANDDQQAWVATVEDGADFGPGFFHRLSRGGGDRHGLLHRGRSGHRPNGGDAQVIEALHDKTAIKNKAD